MNYKSEPNDMELFTKAKNLIKYVIDVTEKSPKQYRVAFVNRLQGYALGVLENLISANMMQVKTNLANRKSYQHTAHVQLHLLSNFAYIAMQSGAITPKNFTEIGKHVNDTTALLTAWGTSDTKRAIA